MDRVPPAAWAKIDRALFEGRRFEAIDATRRASSCGLVEVLELVHQRWSLLIESRRAEFKVPLEGYWNDVIT
jgi:hypothetical protein